MTLNSGLSFLSRFDPNEFYEIAKDLPTTIELTQQNDDSMNQNAQVIGTHLLVPEHSIAQMLNSCLNNSDENQILDLNNYNDLLPFMDHGPPTSNLPSIDPFNGPYNFNISILSSEGPVKKSTSWTFSSTLNKLYCNPNVACPVDISVSSLPPSGSIIRAMPVYGKYEHIEQIVTRCENHKKSKEFDNDVDLPEEALSHFIRCRHNQAIYEQDITTQRQSVTVPFEKPQTGSAYSTILYQFMCYSSCVGGSQKPLRIVLTLEFNGEILGRLSFEIKICACPGRDRTTDENKFNKQKNIQKLKEPKKEETIVKNPSIKNTESVIVDNDSQELFTLVIKGRKNYEILKNLNEALKIQDLYSKLVKTKSQTNSKIIKTGSVLLRKNSDLPKRKLEIKTLEEFLESIDMSAYYNLIISKGIKDLNSLLRATRKKVNAFKISESDTNKLWNSIQAFKNGNAEGNSTKKEKLESTNEQKLESFSSLANFDFTQSNLINDSFLNNQNNEKYIRLSKYQVKYTLGTNP
ncbi:unnamed protein product [Brachionus calyciflorus]|uniref:Cellular tumor antigen p53 n=1 Tax=Brachionus calyciflorus TaxID=104777 RepID=A0A813TRH8_9BILA|nr:unnamed protein product [Brachionus calyciflorus]